MAGTGAVGTETLEMSINEAGVAGTGAVPLYLHRRKGVSGRWRARACGVEALSYLLMRLALQGTGAVRC